MSRRTTRIAAIAVLLAACVAGAAHAGAYYTSSSTDGAGNITVQWNYYEDPQYPSGHPEWVGYDVLRRAVPGCASFVRVNATIYPRTIGATEGFSFTEPAPAQGTTYEYKVIMVDANRQQLFLGFPACDMCAPQTWASAPAFSAPVIVGTFEDWGWTLFVHPTAGCYPFAYLAGNWDQSLRNFVASGTPVRLFGTIGCGTVEGCALTVDHWEVADPTPTARPTWGRIKTLYR